MDKELVERVTKMVVTVLEEMQEEDSNKKITIKIWPHESPLPDPVERQAEEVEQKRGEVITLKPYTKGI
ncbi:hypothetical protein [Oceanobacillus neutriphilus]|uniref:Uncharacterized protein n=1 Tax=Oceanobacillus neutriphilus TaxID=531815 RepID=A0ABQ2NXC1_9BACI|nr:hypothetical protein [Oceanobacillus neutriphilus]GGP12893.1 hypothetical protein GCM10011346_30700 [Oceanobacillus neutriphilus]